MVLYKPNTDQLLADNGGIFSNTTIKIIVVVMIGICIPNITGLITNHIYPLPLLFINYACFTALTWLVWSGNIKLMTALKARLKIPNNNYSKDIMLLLAMVITFTIVVSSVALFTWRYFSLENKTGLRPVTNTIVLITLAAIFITNLYENYFLNQEYADTLNRVEQLNLAKTHAELVALKNQIDPHFIFNSLNTLSYLISSSPANAKLYNNTLAKVYQYILINREKNLVPLMEEIEFMSNYFYLLKIRFDNAINMSIEIKDTEAGELFILPISLQILMENVMKHNDLNQENPLTIHVTVGSDYVWVRNKIYKKSYPVSTSKVGLSNLDNRYKLLTGKNIHIQNNAGTFAVRLPLINLNK